LFTLILTSLDLDFFASDRSQILIQLDPVGSRIDLVDLFN